MIASSSPNTKAASVPQANPSILPSGSIYDYRFTAGPYAGMTYQEVVKYLQNYSQSVNQATNGKPSKPLTGSTQGDQALGLVGGIGTAAAVRYGLGQIGSQTVAQTTAQTAGQAGSQALAQGGAQVGSQALAQGGAQGSYQLAGTLGSQGAADLSVQGGSQVAGQGAGSTISTYAPMAAGAYYAGTGIYNQIGRMTDGQITEADRRRLGATIFSPAAMGLYDSLGGEKTGVNQNDAVNGALAGSIVGIPLALVNMGLSAAGVNLYGTKREAERMNRKMVGRKIAQKVGFMGPDSRSQYLLQDGSKFDIRDYKKNTEKQAFDVDFNEQGAGDKVGRLHALTSALYGQGKIKDDMTGELYNAYNSNGQFDQNYRAASEQLGGHDRVYQGILDRWKKDKKFSADDRDAALAAIDKEYGIANPTGARWDASLQGKDLDRNVKELAEADKKKAEAKAKAEANKKEDPKKPREYSNPRFK